MSFRRVIWIIPEKSLISYLYGCPVGVYHEMVVHNQELSNLLA
jgi:hypothetical protein